MRYTEIGKWQGDNNKTIPFSQHPPEGAGELIHTSVRTERSRSTQPPSFDSAQDEQNVVIFFYRPLPYSRPKNNS